MNFLLPILSFLLGNAKSMFKEPREAFTQQVVLHLRAVVILVVIGVGSLALFCVGVSLLISHLATQLDSSSSFSWGVGTSIYTGLTVISLGVLLFSLRQRTWLKSMGFEARGPSATAGSGKKGSPLENAVALLVMDFVEERQRRRNSSGDQN